MGASAATRCAGLRSATSSNGRRPSTARPRWGTIDTVADTVAETPPLYGEGARALQDHYDSRRLADRLEGLTVHGELTDDDIALIGAQRCCWLATVDAWGWPDVSYKGGEPGFVRVVDRTTLELPVFDGNGMWRSLGNITDDGRVALLFVDLDRPWRLRLHGTATVVTDPREVGSRHGAVALVRVSLARAFPNCGRYIDGLREGEVSKYVPRPGHEPPVPEWKQVPIMAEVLPGTPS